MIKITKYLLAFSKNFILNGHEFVEISGKKVANQGYVKFSILNHSEMLVNDSKNM